MDQAGALWGKDFLGAVWDLFILLAADPSVVRQTDWQLTVDSSRFSSIGY
jgi:hypothetical protein